MAVSSVFIALQSNDESRFIIEAIRQDNPAAMVDEQPAMYKVNCPSYLVINRERVSEMMGRDFDLQELHVHMISISGHVDETEDEFSLRWN